MYKVHRVVYESVTGEPIPEGYEINHRNEIKTDNSFSNLELLTHKENNNFGTRNDRISKTMTNGKTSKQAGAFDNNGELIMSFPSTNEAGRNGFNASAVSACCRGVKYYKTYKGFTWRYL